MNRVEIILFIPTVIITIIVFWNLVKHFIKEYTSWRHKKELIGLGKKNAKQAKFESLFICACGCGKTCNPNNGDLYDNKWRNWWKLDCYKRTIGDQT